ncbi:MAG: PBP1A family penicillin-binding protein [Pseudomonadota bacterium]
MALKTGAGGKAGSVGKAGASRKRPSKRPLRWRIIKYSALAFAAFTLSGVAAAAIYHRILIHDMPTLPDTAALWTVNRAPAMEFRAEDGALIAVRGPRYGRETAVADVPAHVSQAFIAAEDKRFYSHNGADTWAIIRAAWVNWRSGRTVSGASTITQQLIKNLVLDPRQTIKRKVQEVELARQLERRLTKDEILALYLNRVYFGAGLYGLDAASTHYFGKPPEDLTLSEASLLAALPQAPSRMALTGDMSLARARQDYVLSEMVSAGFISELQAEFARSEEIAVLERPAEAPVFGYAIDAAVAQLPDLLGGAPPPDLVITLTIEPELQAQVQATIAETLEASGEEARASQAAALVLRSDGHIAAMTGGTDYTVSEFNRATQARRQPGSAFKAVVYAAALEVGNSPYDVRADRPLQIGRWSPKNYGGGHLGTVTLAEAYAESLNTVSALLTQEVGEEAVIHLARRLGMSSEMTPVPSIALGSQEVTLLDLTRAYGAFMRDGLRLDPVLVTRIEDTRGALLYEAPLPTTRRAIDSNVARDMTSMMVRTVEQGTGLSAQVPGRRVAGKTGTSQDWRDAWFIGYSATNVVGVWVGNDDDSPMDRVTGGGLPAELFAQLMTLAEPEGTPEGRLPGAERYVALGEASEQRIAFYRALSGAFAGVSGRDVATVQGASAAAPAQRP